jgi:YbbR domain-containing protein
MLNTLRRIARLLPTLLTAFVLAIAVWISAVTANDPMEERAYPEAVVIEIVGQDPGMVITSGSPGSVSLILEAPSSIWTQLQNERGAVRAFVDLSGLQAGTYSLPIQVQIVPRPVRIITQSPTTLNVSMEVLATKELPITLVQRGEVATGYLAELPTSERDTVTITGPQSLVDRVITARASIDISQVSETINRVVTVQLLDENDQPVNGLTLTPDRITVNQVISQRFGYRNVVVTVVMTGQVASGYRLTNISVFPPAVTVFSTDPQVVSALPGFVETLPVDISGARDDVDISVALDLPEGVAIVGNQTEVLVRVSIAAVESSLTLPNVPIEIIGLSPNQTGIVEPETVTVIISGPMALLDRLQASDVRVIVNLENTPAGSYQIEPEVEILISDLIAESILPETVTVTVTGSPTLTP